MVELGDLREGVAAAEVVAAADHVGQQPGLLLVGIGTNLACQSGIVPDQAKMDELSALAERVEAHTGRRLALHLDAFALVAEVIEVATKPAQPWGHRAQGAFGEVLPRAATGTVRQAILAVGRQDVGLVAPPGIAILGMSSDHLIVDVGDHDVAVGQELQFGLGYGALVRAATSPFVMTVPTPVPATVH